MNLSWSILDVQEQPFRYAVLDSVLEEASAEEILHWLEGVNFWKLTKTDFYEQYEFSVEDVDLPGTVAFLKHPTFVQAILSFMEKLFQTSLESKVSLVAHKLVPTQHIGIHNDYMLNSESYRLTLLLSRTHDETAGGLFMLFNSQNVEDVHRIFRPINNSALAFAISPRSFHAVSRQNVGTRFTLVFSFYDQV